ncbi:hypothetical protein Tco_0717781 [Tanacetum coccineum]
MLLFIGYCLSEHYSSETLFTSRNCPSREGMEGKSFEEGLAEITETLKQLQSTLLFHQTKLKESFRQARQDFSLARQDISLATKKLHRSIKAAIKEEVDHEEQFDFLGVQLNQRIPNRTVKARKVKARLFWRKFIVTIDRTRRPKSIQSVVMLRLGHHHPSVARGNIRVLGLNVKRVRQHPPRLVYQVCYWPILHYMGNQRQIWDPGIMWLKISKEHLEDKVFLRGEGNPLRTPWLLTSDRRIKVGYNSIFLTPEFCYGIETHMGCMKGSGLLECRTENDNFSRQNGESIADVMTSVTDRKKANNDLKLIWVTVFPKKPLDGDHEIHIFCLRHTEYTKTMNWRCQSMDVEKWMSAQYNINFTHSMCENDRTAAIKSEFSANMVRNDLEVVKAAASTPESSDESTKPIEISQTLQLATMFGVWIYMLERIFKKKAKNKQSQARDGKDQVKSKPKSVKVRKSTQTKSKVNQMKKIQLKGPKLPNLKLYYKSKRQGSKLQNRAKFAMKL